MTASARMAEVVSSNVSNALTEGYGRRSLNLSSGVVGGRGTGVEIGQITRHVDHGILSDRRLSDARLNAFETLAQTSKTVQNIIGEVGSDNAISDRIVAVERALIDAASDPSSYARLNTLQDRFQDLTGALNSAAKQVQAERARSDSNIAAQVDELNAALSQVERLNGDITYSVNTGGDPSGLIDARDVVIDQIAELVPVRSLARENGRVALMTPQGEMLIDGPAKVFGFVPNPVVTADMSLASGGLSAVTFDGTAVGPDGIGRLADGALGASFLARDTVLTDAQSALDKIAADLIGRFQDPAVDPTLAPGQAGLLTDAGTAFDPADLLGLSERISVNGTVDPEQGGIVTNLRDGAQATGPGLAGDSSLLLSLSDALTTPKSGVSDPSQTGAASRATRLQGDIGETRLGFEAELAFESSRWNSLKEAEAAQGVDTDFEMQMLLRIEQAYAANARVIQTVNSLMQRLMEI